LAIDRTHGDVLAEAVLATEVLEDFISFDSSYHSSAYLNDEHFGIASQGYTNPNGIASFLVSGKATVTGLEASCTCAYLHWGYWAALQDTGSDLAPDNPFVAGVFVAGQPTVDMPIDGTATFSGVAEAAWREPTSINPDGIVTVAAGGFFHSVNFSNGQGSGTMVLAGVTYQSFSTHDVGEPQVEFVFQEQADVYGSFGSGNGIFIGPDAKNLGVNFEMQGRDGFGAAGIIRAEHNGITPP